MKFLRLNPDYQSRVFGLDILRSLAIIFVVMGHGGMLRRVGSDFPWLRLIDGVELFFVLSGFLIGGILIKLFFSDKPFTFKTLGQFWIRRWFRTLPNYYLILLLNVIVVYFGWIDEDFSQFNWKFIFFLQNFASPFQAFFWESWSLSIEEWFYLFYPVILMLVFLIARLVKVPKIHIFLIAIIIFLLIPLLLRVFIASTYEVDQYWLETKIYKVVIFRLDSIAYGIFAALLAFRFKTFWKKCRFWFFAAGLLLTYVVLYTQWEPNSFATKVFFNSLQSIGCFLLLPLFDSIRTGPRLLLRIFTHISLISYSMYLLNLALIAEVLNKYFPPLNYAHAWIQYGLYWFLVIFLSTLLYKYFEKPMMDLREKFRR